MFNQKLSDDVFLEKYSKNGETRDDVFRRVAKGLASIEKNPEYWEPVFYQNMLDGWVGGGRIMATIGTNSEATAINCFSLYVGDSMIEDYPDKPSIMTSLANAAESLRKGGGCGYDFTPIRPKGAWVNKTQSEASGPIPFIRMFNAMNQTVMAGGNRRGANLSALDISHPDIKDYINAKQQPGLTEFNMSVLVTDEFMNAVKDDLEWELVHEKAPSERLIKEGAYKHGDKWCYKTVKSRELWDLIMHSTYNAAEPGILFYDNINNYNNLSYCETIRNTNPCVIGSSRLHTQYGLVRVDDLYKSGLPLIATVDSRTQNRRLDKGKLGIELHAAKPIFKTSDSSDVWEVTTKAGYSVTATSYHEFYTQRGKITLQELVIGDSLWLQSGKGQFGTEGNYDLGLLIGLITGDGHFSYTNTNTFDTIATIGLWGEARQLSDKVVKAVNKLLCNPHYKVSAQHYDICDTSQVSSKLLADIFRKYGFTVSSKLEVPEVIWKGTEECVKGYLAGLFQTDGTVNACNSNGTCSVRLGSISNDLLHDVQMLLSNFGIYSKIYLRNKSNLNYLPDGKGGKKEYLCQDFYELVVDGHSRDRFMNEIGFFTPHNTDKYYKWVKDRPLKKKTKFIDEIISIEYKGKQATYCTTQPDYNSIIVNGIVTGQCGEVPIPPNGCCCLGQIILTKFVDNPFTKDAKFDFEKFNRVVIIGTRMLDNVLDVTHWPLEQQRQEAMNKRRIGLGYTGLGNVLAMLGIKYNSEEGLSFAELITRTMRDVSYTTSIDLAKEKGAFPIISNAHYQTNAFRNLPDSIQRGIREYGIRNSHLMALAPVGTVSLAFADNCSGGLEPSFSWEYERKKRTIDGHEMYKVQDYAYALYRSFYPNKPLPEYFITALEMSAMDHVNMLAAVQKYIDQSCSKTINIPEDYPFEEFKDIYFEAWKKGCKGVATYRPNKITGSILSVTPSNAVSPATDIVEINPIVAVNHHSLESLKWENRPYFENGNHSHTFLIGTTTGRFAVFIGLTDDNMPFEIWLAGKYPRTLGSLAKNLSMDMRSNDKLWLKNKLELLMRVNGDDVKQDSGNGGASITSSATSNIASILYRYCNGVGLFDNTTNTPVVDSQFRIPITGTAGTMSWSVDIENPNMGDSFLLGLREVVVNGIRRPYKVFVAGNYPSGLDGLCVSLTEDCRVTDINWFKTKLYQLLTYGEPGADFLAKDPKSGKMINWSSVVSYIARLILYRLEILKSIDTIKPIEVRLEKKCPDCGSSLIKKDGCTECSNCTWRGDCG